VFARPSVAPNKAECVSVCMCVSEARTARAPHPALESRALGWDMTRVPRTWSSLKPSFLFCGYYCSTETRSPAQRKVTLCIIFIICIIFITVQMPGECVRPDGKCVTHCRCVCVCVCVCSRARFHIPAMQSKVNKQSKKGPAFWIMINQIHKLLKASNPLQDAVDDRLQQSVV